MGHSNVESANNLILKGYEEITMKFRPLHDRVVVKRLDGEEKTASGIIIPDSAREKPMQGKIIPLDVKAGDTVLFGKWSGTEVKIDNEDYLIMKESDIMRSLTS